MPAEGMVIGMGMGPGKGRSGVSLEQNMSVICAGLTMCGGEVRCRQVRRVSSVFAVEDADVCSRCSLSS